MKITSNKAEVLDWVGEMSYFSECRHDCIKPHYMNYNVSPFGICKKGVDDFLNCLTDFEMTYFKDKEDDIRYEILSKDKPWIIDKLVEQMVEYDGPFGPVELLW